MSCLINKLVKDNANERVKSLGEVRLTTPEGGVQAKLSRKAHLTIGNLVDTDIK